MNNSKEFLGTEPIGKLLFKLAVPSVIAQIVNMLYNIVDRIYIGHIPGSGSLALTGVGVCLPIIMVVSAFAALVGSGAESVDLYGKRRYGLRGEDPWWLLHGPDHHLRDLDGDLVAVWPFYAVGIRCQ